MSSVQPGQTIAVWFSSGAASAAAAIITKALYGDIANIRVLSNPIKEEHPDNTRFLHDMEEVLGVEIELVRHPDYPDSSCVEVWDDRRFMSSPHGAPCTLKLKKEARMLWEDDNHVDWNVLGFTSEEKHRADRWRNVEGGDLLPVLIHEGVTKEDCYNLVTLAGVRLPESYFLGYPNANCLGCVKATSPTYWNHVRRTHPEVFEHRAIQSRDIGAKLVRVKGERIYLDELDPSAKGNSMKSMNIECGIFCGSEDN